MKTIPSLLIAAVFATLTFAVWAYLNRPTREPPWPPLIQGFAFSPFRANEDPTRFEMPTDAEIDADLALLEGKVGVDLRVSGHLEAGRILVGAEG